MSTAATPERRSRPGGIGVFLKTRRQQIDRDSRSLGPFLRLPDRVGKPVTQEEIAELLDVSRTWYALLEAEGARASPALLDRIAKLFGLEGDERLELFALAIPELQTSPKAPSSALELTVGSSSQIESTARKLNAIRERFLGKGNGTDHIARPRIMQSWARCLEAGVDAGLRAAPLCVARDSDLRSLREENERLLRATRGVVAYLEEQLAGSGYAVIITDRTGCVLDLTGEAEIRRRLTALDLIPGGLWNEASAGTNAIGTAIADGRPLQLMAGEHFCDGWTDLTCTAAPIREPKSFEIIGVLDITGSYKLIRSHLIALIMQCALEIEEELALLDG
jgi:transcriptional regulator with XRE-family HTH domain